MIKSIKAITILIIFSLFAISCSNSASGEEEEHHPDGFRLKMNGQTVVEQLPEQNNVTGEFELEPGEETDLITIYFLDHDGHEFQPEEEGYSLRHEFSEEGVVESEQHAEDGKWSFHLHAESEGVTNMKLKLFHGTHSDFTSQDIHVHVEATEE